MCKYVTGWAEKNLIPEYLSPNFVTVAGQVPNLIMLAVMLTQVGATANGTVFPPCHYFYMLSFATQWFSWFDMMDGIRARRQKSGSPLGRIVDEAFDMIMQSLAPMWLAYGF